jgi:hypothetical protein
VIAFAVSKGYTRREVIYEIPYISLLLELASTYLPKKKDKKDENDKVINFFMGL